MFLAENPDLAKPQPVVPLMLNQSSLAQEYFDSSVVQPFP